MKVISFILLICFISSRFLKLPEIKRPLEKFVSMADVSSSQDYDETKVKLIETSFDMTYSSSLHFKYSNSPVAPRTDGGYYIAFADTYKYLHVLSYDKNDKLLKDFNTQNKANPVDITATENGFAVYMIEAGSSYHSYLSLYNKSFQLVKKVEIMNNLESDDKTVDSTLQKQVIRYGTDRKPVFGMRFMYRPDSGKLIYSGKRIFLIFSHYNHFLDSGGHTGDTIVTFDSTLNDMDFGTTWGASHSLIQSVTADSNYIWTAALSDAYPMGIRVSYTSKTEFSTSMDPVNNKKNLRKGGADETLAGDITGYMNGQADGKLGGLLYFEKSGLYCLVYAKTPNAADSKNVIYMTTWKFENNKITDAKTMTVKTFTSGKNVMQVRAGKFGDDKAFITYMETSTEGGNGYGNVPKGTTPYFFLIDVPNRKKLKSDVQLTKLIMNTNEDLRTFGDGVLLWATSNKDGKLSIIKIGTVNY
jgi:hypothetical protein